MPIVTNIFGNNSNDALTYVISDVNIGGNIDNAKWSEILTNANTERARRGLSAYSDPGLTGNVQAADLNQIINAIHTNTPPALGTGGFLDRFGFQTNASYKNTSNTTINFTQATAYTAGKAPDEIVGGTVFASDINGTIDKLQGSGAVCVCNCNYCTCNCNYCTCNCNYACTCNCNYSDKRLKKNIKFLKNIHGLNIYSWKYIGINQKTYSGVIAQELIGTKYESALSVDANGYYMVDYSQLPVDMKIHKET